jgi:CDP-diacylglycerol--glycerol-3-phosphate 3-phosphatidyltransferase
LRRINRTDLTVPNALTVLRILMAIASALILALGRDTVLAAVMLISASFLDFFDGWYARKFKQTTRLGAHLDPFADKILTTVIFVALSWKLGWAWFTFFTAVIIVREASVTFHRMLVRRRSGGMVPSSLFGKIKTAGQSTLGDILLFYVFIFPAAIPESNWMIFSAMLLVTAITVDSGFRYLLPRCSDGKKRSLVERLVMWLYGISVRGA